MNYTDITLKFGSNLRGFPKKVGHNTYIERDEYGNYYLRLHRTRIITWRPSGSIILNSGGWTTRTTKDRLNKWIRGYIYQKDFSWYYVDESGAMHEFFDGIDIGKKPEVC